MEKIKVKTKVIQEGDFVKRVFDLLLPIILIFSSIVVVHAYEPTFDANYINDTSTLVFSGNLLGTKGYITLSVLPATYDRSSQTIDLTNKSAVRVVKSNSDGSFENKIIFNENFKSFFSHNFDAVVITLFTYKVGNKYYFF